MTGLILTAFIFFVVWAIVKNASGVTSFDKLARSGVRGRALVLTSSSTATNMRLGTRRFERRAMTLDVEVPGRAPFVVQGIYLVPRGLVEPIPGSSLEVALDPRGGSQIAILGPGGFTGPWLNIGPPQAY